jgi:hypothetical protein
MDKALIPTLYASIIDITTTESELILEFGSRVSNQENPASEATVQPQVRIVVPLKGAIDLSTAIMQEAQKQEAQKQEKASTSGTPQAGTKTG